MELKWENKKKLMILKLKIYLLMLLKGNLENYKSLSKSKWMIKVEIKLIKQRLQY